MSTIDSRVSDVQYYLYLSNKKLLEDSGVRSSILNYTNPGPSGFYDEAGSVRQSDHPHLDRGQGPLEDPSAYYSPIQTVSPPTHATDESMPFSWFQYSEVYFDNTMWYRYSGIEAEAPEPEP